MQSKGFGNINEILENKNNRKNHLLAIAINDYAFCPKLNNAVKDVEDFIEVMLDKYEFEEENITFLKDGEANKDNIFKHLRNFIKSLSANDNLVIYFSGHGEFDDIEDEGYWLTQEVRQGNHANYLPNTRIKKLISKIKAHHIFLISDSCFSGALFDKSTKSPHEVYERDASRWGLTSGRNEIVTDGKPGENSPFVKSLLYALRNTAEPLPILRLCQKVQDNTTINANQSPRFERIDGSGHRGGQFVFRLKKDEKADWIATQKTNTIQAYQSFITTYPNSSFTIIAKEEIAWKNAQDADTILSYAAYEQVFPKGKYIKAADNRIQYLEEETFWQKTITHPTYSKYRNYLKEYPNGKYKTTAQTAIHTTLEKGKKEAEKRKAEETERQRQAKVEADRIAKEKTAKAKRLTDEKAKQDAVQKAKQKERQQKTIYTTPQPTLWQRIPQQTKRISIIAFALIIGIWGISKISNISDENADITQKESEQQVEQVEQAEQGGIQQVEQGVQAEEMPEPQIDLDVPFDNLMVKVEGGTFMMGSNEYYNTKPIHEVIVPTFYISKVEVTQKQWRDITGKDPEELRFKGCDNCPVESVSWNDIQDFLKKLNQKTGKKYRLPTEAEWEFAARGGNQSKGYKYAGSDNLNEVGYYEDSYISGVEHQNYGPVGTKKSNELGIYDMSGNLWEWCEDTWHDNYQNAPTNGAVWLENGDNSRRVLRGGSWLNDILDCRVAIRIRLSPSDRDSNYGFRVARGI